MSVGSRRARLRRHGLAAGVGVAVVLTSTPLLAQGDPPTSPDDVAQPTTEQLAAAVRRWDPQGSVQVWDPQGSVSAFKAETTEGDETIVTLNTDVLFAFASAEVPPAAAARIAELLSPIPQGADVAVDGHTDSIGDPDSNLDLSQRRAQAVAAVIRESREDLQLRVTGHGETDPVEPNEIGGEDNPEGRAQNRRVEIRYER